MNPTKTMQSASERRALAALNAGIKKLDAETRSTIYQLLEPAGVFPPPHKNGGQP